MSNSRGSAHAINFLATTAATIAGTFIPIYAQQLGADNTGVGILAASASLAVVMASLISGKAADRYGGRLFIVAGLIAAALSTAIQFFAPNYAALLAMRVLNGLALGSFPAALIAHVQAAQQRLGRYSAFGSLGWVVGSLLAGTVATYFTIPGTFLAAALLFGGAFLFAFGLNDTACPERTEKQPSLWRVFRRHHPTYLAIFLRHSGAMMTWAFWPLFLQTLGADYFWIGMISAINSGTQVIVMYYMTDRAWSAGLLRTGLFLSGVTFVTFTLAPNFWWILPTQIILGVSWALIYVGGLRAATEGEPDAGAASGIFTSMLNLSAVIGPLVGTLLVNWGGYYAVLYGGAVTSFAAFLYRHFSLGYGRRQQTQAPAGAPGE